MKKHVLNAALAFVMALSFVFANAQTTNVIQGTVKDSKGEAIVGAAVSVKGTNLGTVTDADGKFSVAAPENAKMLQVKFVGFKPLDVDIAKGNFNITLSEDVFGLDELVVTAIGVKKEKRALGYSVQEVNGDDITKAGNTSALGSLSGKVAGLDVTTSSGAPGAAVNLRLRGATSVTGNNQPLIVVDGVPIDNSQSTTIDNVIYGGAQGAINGDVSQNRGIDINPDDIASVSVLKGGAATALYGIQGASGVILITTKKGSSGKGKSFSVDISSSVTFDQVNKMPDLQNQWVQGSGGQFTPYTTRSWGAKADTLSWNGIQNWVGGPDGSVAYNQNSGDSSSHYDSHGALVGKSDPTAKTPFKPYNNENTFFKTGITTDNNISIAGGSDRGSFRFGVTNVYQKGIIPLSDYNKTAVTINGEAKVGEKVTISGGATYTNSLTDGVLSGNITAGVMYGVLRTPISFDNRNGVSGSYTDPNMYIAGDGHQRSYTYFLGRDGNGNVSYFDNPYFSINKNPYTAQVNRVVGNLQISAEPTPWLSILDRLGVDVFSDRRKQAFALEDASTPEGQDIEDQYFSRNINHDIIATFHHELAKDLNGSVFIANNVYSSYSQNLSVLGDALNFSNFYNLSNAQTIIATESRGRYLTTAVYGGLNLDWKSQIYFGFTARNEWSSTLPPSQRSFFFPAINAGWVFTETAKLSTNKWFPYGKVRFSWSEIGKDAPIYALTTPYAQQNIIDQWTTGISFPFNGSGGFLTSQTLGNPNLKPEITQTYEAGLDLRFMQNLKVFGGFGIDFTYYNMKTKDEIISVPIANSTGYAAALENAGSIQNQGFEIMGTITPVKVKDFTWDMSVNWSKNISKVLSLNGGTKELLLGGFQGSSIYAVVGQPYGVIWGGDFLRDSKGNKVLDDAGTPSTNPNYGFPLADTKNKVIGDPNPKWRMGWRNTFSSHGVSLSLLFDVKFGGQMYNGTRGALVTYGRAAETADRDGNHTFNGVMGHLDANGNLVLSDATASNHTVNFGAIEDPSSGITYGQYWYSGVGGGFGPVSSQFIEDAGYFRLRELSLSYTLDRRIFKGSKYIKSIDLGFIARNVFLITKYTGVDPDQALAGASNIQGLNWFNLPNTRSYGFSVKFHF